MSKQVKTMTMYDGKVFGVKPSKYSLKAGYLDYLTLSKIVGESVRNCYIYDYVGRFYYDIFKKWIPEEKQMDTIVIDGRPLMNTLASQGLGEVVDALQQFGSIVKKVEESK